MKNMLKWRVDSYPTGRYRSFEKRGWPLCSHKETNRSLFAINCNDEYISYKETNHSPLTLLVAKNYLEPDKKGWRWVKMTTTFATLKEAKEKAKYLFETYPEWFI